MPSLGDYLVVRSRRVGTDASLIVAPWAGRGRMFERRREGDRRSEERWPAAGRISWQKAYGFESGWGVLSDASCSSVSFVTSARGRPEPGAQVNIVAGDHPKGSYRVARVAAFDEKLSLIACRSVCAAG